MIKNKRLITKNAGSEAYSYAYNRRGQLARAENSQGILTRQYDDAGQLIGENFNGVSLSMTLNADGERIRLAALNGVTEYERDDRGLISNIVDESGTYSFSYDQNGFYTQLQYPNSTIKTVNRDADQQITDIVHSGIFNDSPILYLR